MVTDGASTVEVTVFDCENFAQKDVVEAAVTKYAGDYAWSMYETGGDYKNKLFRFEGDADGEAIKDAEDNEIQGSLGQVLLLHTATRDCLSWFTSSADEAIDSIPKMLFDMGYDVWLGCNRGTMFSLAHETFDLATEEGRCDYFNYNT